MSDRICSFDSCVRPCHGRGLCRTHYMRWWRYGDPAVAPLPRDGEAARFWRKVDKGGPVPDHRPDLGGCWLWTGARLKTGYAYGTFRSGRENTAHRWSYAAAYGPIPPGMHVCHHCDNPPCVNPAHLFLGTRSDNMRDMVAKGRHASAGRSLTRERVVVHEGP